MEVGDLHTYIRLSIIQVLGAASLQFIDGGLSDPFFFFCFSLFRLAYHMILDSWQKKKIARGE